MTWILTDNQLTQQGLLLAESLFSLGNGYIGVRGNFEEGYAEGMSSIRGTYQNAFHDIIDIPYGEKLFAFPETQQKIVNVIDAQTVEIFLGDDEERFSLFEGEILSYSRQLNLADGYLTRTAHWRSPNGKEAIITFRRVVSFVVRELFAIDILLEPVNFHGPVKVVSAVKGAVSNFVDSKDPRVGSGHAKRLHVKDTGVRDNLIFVVDETYTSKLQTACVISHQIPEGSRAEFNKTDTGAKAVFSFALTHAARITKWNIYTDTLRHGEEVLQRGLEIQQQISNSSFEEILEKQKEYLDAYWDGADITIGGDEKLQEGIRFNLFHLLQSVGKDPFSNIAAKGLSGEGYEGHYFWDTEIYIFPLFLMVNPKLARQLLFYRYSILDHARERAKEMGHKKGALFPWRTISGKECSSYFPAGTAQYHISADVAYSYVQYYLATADDNFLMEFGAEVLFETARLWMDAGHYHNGSFKIDAVTGPDEYTCIVNNNYYTNVMAKYNLAWAAKVYIRLEELGAAELADLISRIHVSADEASEWKQAAGSMYLPYDETLKINPQDDSFLQKAVWDFESTPDNHYPLLLHYHPLTLYRYQVCKQADTVLAHFLLEDEQELETIRNSFHYYEKITTHDSSLSSCIFSIMASKIGAHGKAYEYFIETARLDLDNTHGNTKDGLHMANMGGTWMSIVYGFAGLRLKESGISLAPAIPDSWSGYAFKLQYQGRKLEIGINREETSVCLLSGEPMAIKLYGQKIMLEKGHPYRAKLLPQN
ncbi:glycoside hydrolase family 65 protein [Bacillus sp. T33-2]|uniref:glycoside hydrolase family 65 protein n=1 Tax=Bacillus sp. T33-2 TaxID=2054168 RepID=UPI000C75C736|nr:glycosyl hydrolase family 65 protein [Bacillus sp. T33-2]PLR96542.1 family 65 glycosyl hydrolase [Bacillus sp. T33-2]